jgi:hypothetical protein
MAVKLTYAQAETLAALYAAGIISNEITFRSLDIFPNRDNRDNGRRRCVTSLARKGLLKSCPYDSSRYRPDRAKCDAAWDAWRQQNPDAEFWQYS